jgi:hypothetical protein
MMTDSKEILVSILSDMYEKSESILGEEAGIDFLMFMKIQKNMTMTSIWTIYLSDKNMKTFNID